MKKTASKQAVLALDQKEVDFFIDRLIEILMQQVEDNNENENKYEKTNRIHQVV